MAMVCAIDTMIDISMTMTIDIDIMTTTDMIGGHIGSNKTINSNFINFISK